METQLATDRWPFERGIWLQEDISGLKSLAPVTLQGFAQWLGIVTYLSPSLSEEENYRL